MSMRVFIRRLKGNDGAEIAEAALVLPLVFMLIFGTIWFGRAFNIYSTIQQAAQQGVITAARNGCATCGNAAATDAAVISSVEAVMKASSVDPLQIINPGAAPAGCTTPGNITVCRQVLLNPATNPSQIQPCGTPTSSQICGALVTFQYPFAFTFPGTSLNMQRIVMTAQAQTRREN